MSKLKEIEMSKLTYPHVHTKSWGQEEWFENNEKYCGKLLTVYKGLWSSNGKFHYHKIKDETFYVVDGILILDVEVDGIIRTLFLDVGCSFRVKPGTKHRFTSKTGSCAFIEVSTTHRDDDSYRCYWDHTERKWVEG